MRLNDVTQATAKIDPGSNRLIISVAAHFFLTPRISILNYPVISFRAKLI